MALNNGLAEMIVPDKPNSRLQKYRLTTKGIAYLKKQKKLNHEKHELNEM